MGHERAGHSMQATALVNEAYLRLIDASDVDWHDRAHFLAIAARIMRRILVDHARARLSQKRGGEATRITFDEALVVTSEPGEDFVALDDAMEALAKFDERKCRVVELILRRSDGRGNRLGAESLSRHGGARLADGERLAQTRDARQPCVIETEAKEPYCWSPPIWSRDTDPC